MSDETGDSVLSPGQDRRLEQLLDLQDEGLLKNGEQVELDALVAAYGRAVSERGFRDLAQQRGTTPDQIRNEVLAETNRVLAWWQKVQADPALLEEVVRDAVERRRTHAG